MKKDREHLRRLLGTFEGRTGLIGIDDQGRDNQSLFL